MEPARFILRKPKWKKQTSIYFIARFNNLRFIYSIGKKIVPDYWDFDSQRAIESNSNKKLKERGLRISKEIIKENSTINGIIQEYIRHYKNEIDNIERNSIIPTLQYFKNSFEKVDFGAKKQVGNKKEVTLNSFIDQFIVDIENGNRTTEKGKRYEKSTIKNFKGFQVQFQEFQGRRKYNFDDITIDFYDRFVTFFNNKKYSPNTIGRHIKNLKTIMRLAKEEGNHNNTATQQRKFKTIIVESDSIYLNENELRIIKELDLSDDKVIEVIKPDNKKLKIHYRELSLARDVFLIGCYTALRFSDYSRISKENIHKKANGNRVVEISTKKTGEKVIIPLHPYLQEILMKYNYTVPKTYEQKVNLRIKIVGQLAKIDDDIAIESYKGGLKVKKVLKKYELIKTHTARRSGATNMYLAGINTIDIMKLTGHRTETSFMKYIKVTKEETADKLAKHPFFNPSILKKIII
jgi:integrase